MKTSLSLVNYEKKLSRIKEGLQGQYWSWLYTLTSGLTMLYLHVTLRDVNRNKSMYRNSKSVRLAKI